MAKILCWLWVMFLVLGGAGIYSVQAASARSVHADPQKLPGINCRDCHTQKQPAPGTAKEEIRSTLDPHSDQKCLQCHAEDVLPSCKLSASKEASIRLLGQIPRFPLPLVHNQIGCPSCHITHQLPEKDKNPFLLRKEYQAFRQTAESINPHKPGTFCFLCHEKEPRAGDKDLHLKSGGNIVQVCKGCHDNKRAKADNHPVGIIPSKERGVKVPEKFPLKEGKLTCITCHQMPCQGKTESLFFLRGGPYQRRIDTCLVCHVREQYEKINPHDQVTESGEIREDRCLFCHDINKENAAGLAFKFKAPFKFYCLGCHPISIEKHPFGAHHTGRQLHTIWEDLKPSERIELSQQERFKMFPISISGKIMCTTCHNPHDIRKGPKLRINDVNKSCRQCHYKKYGQIIPADISSSGQWARRQDVQAPSPVQETPSENDLDPGKEDKVPFGYRASLSYYCIGCHANKETNHPYGTVHTGKFVKRFWANKFEPKGVVNTSAGAQSGESKGVENSDSLDIQIFPLTLSGQIGCFTCHDPHNGAKGPKLRVESKERLCTLCHPNRAGIIEKYLKNNPGQERQK